MGEVGGANMGEVNKRVGTPSCASFFRCKLTTYEWRLSSLHRGTVQKWVRSIRGWEHRVAHIVCPTYT
jgi:hypothetical protein